MSRLRPLLVALTSLAVVAAAEPPTGTGGDDAATEPDVALTVSAITGVVGEGAPRPADTEPVEDLTIRVLLENRGRAPVEDLTLLTEVFDRATFRSQLHAAIDDNAPLTGLREAERVEVRGGAAVASGEVVGVEVRVAASGIGWRSRTGVYPLRVSVLHGRQPLDEVDTAVVHLAGTPSTPLPALIGWPLDAPPGGLGSVALDDLGRIERLVAAIDEGAGSVQLLIAPHLVEDLIVAAEAGDDAAARLVDRLRGMAAELPAPVTGPYADADVAGLVAADLDLEASRAVSLSPGRLADALGRAPVAETVWASTRLDRASLRTVLDPLGVTTVVLPWQQLRAADAGVDPDRTPVAVQTVRSGPAEVVAAVGDPWLHDLLDDLPDDHGPVVATQRIVAETALVYLEAPNATDRGLVVLPPPGWDPHPRVPAALLRALRRAPWLEPVDLSGLLGTVAPPAEATATSQIATDPIPQTLARDIRLTRERLTALREAVTADAPGGRTWDELDRHVLRVASTWWRDRRPGQASVLLSDLQDVLTIAAGEIRLPANQRLTLTDDDAQLVPVTISRPSGPPIRVVIELDAPAKLEFPEGNARLITLTAGSRHTLSIPALPQAAGRFPVRVLVKTPGALDPVGSPWVQLAESTIVVQSRAISVNAIATLLVVFALLLVWWVYRRLRPRPPQLQVVRDRAA